MANTAALGGAAAEALFEPANSCGGRPRPYNHEIVAPHVAAIDTVALGHEFVLAGPIMDLRIAAFSDRKGLAGANCDNVKIDAACGFE
jgi:hypothetical protein